MNNMKRIAILGASYLQKPLVEKANSMGLETHCFAWDNDLAICKYLANHFYPISVLDKEAILNVCQNINIDAITTIATDICIPTISYVADKMNLIANSVESSILSTNKAEMRKAFDINKVKSPKFISISNQDEYDWNNIPFPIIIKPTDRSGSRGVTKILERNQIKPAFQRALEQSIEKKVIIEEYIEGKEVSVESISWKGKHYILAITDKITTGAPYFVELEHHQPANISEIVLQNLELQVSRTLDALKIQYGASHSEFKILDNGEVVVIEVASRMGGDFIGSHLVPLSTGYDFLKGVINVALNYFEEPIVSAGSYSGVYFLSLETKRLKKYFINHNVFDIEKQSRTEELKYIENSNDRSGYLIYKSDIKINLL